MAMVAIGAGETMSRCLNRGHLLRRSTALWMLYNHGQLAHALWFLESSLELSHEDAYVTLFRLYE
uniref:Uncharacterized protein n=1 Tax=Oryza brachyantha TaxID=4533 RepID=J3LS08_ORYBR